MCAAKGRGWRLCAIALWMAAAGAAWGQTGNVADIKRRLARYAEVRLTADLSHLSRRQRKMIPHLIRAAEAMDEIFWLEAAGGRQYSRWKANDPIVRRYVDLNYGPWDRLDGNRPFLPRVGPKPLGANFYPATMTRERFQNYLRRHPEQAERLTSLYTLVREQQPGRLTAVAYHEAFAEPTRKAVAALRDAALLAEDRGFRRYLSARARALETDEYRESDRLWMDMKTNPLDIVIGPIETYEDQLFGYKAAHEAYVLVKDLQWSRKLAHYSRMLPRWQAALPVPAAYRREKPGTNSDLNAYDVIYYAGDCNAGSKTIAINLPNDERVQLEKGTRRLQLKNAMRAKFDKILLPIAEIVIAPEQRKHVTFDAFFANTMFHEVAHGLGIKFTLEDHRPVRTALKDAASSIEEGKADILGLFIITQLADEGQLESGTLEDHYVTFLAGIFRSVRFGAASAHGRANMIRFHFFQRERAFVRQEDGTYRVDFTRMRSAVEKLSRRLLTLQGDGDYAGARRLIDTMGTISASLRADLRRVEAQGVPVDIVFRQGLTELELEAAE